MSFDWISILTGAGFATLAKLIWDIVKFYINREDKKERALKEFAKKQNKMESLFNDLITSAVNIQELLENFANNHNVTRVSLLKMENGGGVPQLGTVQHISILNEAIHPDKYEQVETLKQDFQQYIIGTEYQKMMKNIFHQDSGMILKDTDELEDGVLKQIYQSDGIQKFLVVPIVLIPTLPDNLTKGFLIYMTIEFSDSRVVTPDLSSDYIILRQKIKKIFQEFYVERISNFD